MKTVSTSMQRLAVKKFIQDELLKRGYTAPITSFKEEEARNGGTYFTFETDYFQTTPVIFRTLMVQNFNSSISKEEVLENGYKIRRIWIQVHISYEHFNGGTNGSSLFEVRGVLTEDGKVYDLEAH